MDTASVEFFNEALRSPNHKTCFTFALGCIQNFYFSIHFCPFGLVSTWPHQNCRAWLKLYGHPRAKLKLVLRLGDLKASLKNSTAKSIHKTSSSSLDWWATIHEWLLHCTYFFAVARIFHTAHSTCHPWNKVNVGRLSCVLLSYNSASSQLALLLLHTYRTSLH